MADDRRVNRTRRLLQQAFVELLCERGYDRITVRDIVDRANVGRSTFWMSCSLPVTKVLPTVSASGPGCSPPSRPESCARKIEAGLRPALADGETARSLEVVANFLAGTQIGLVRWWLEAHRTARLAEAARLLHGFQRAVIRAAFGR